MNFHSFSFAIFLALVFGSFWLVVNRRGLRTGILLLASYFFYGCYGWWLLGLIIFSTFLDWNCGHAIERATDKGRKKLFLMISLVGNLGLLAFFKYYEWGVSSLEMVLNQFDIDFPHEVIVTVVPVGISFYTFQTLSYTIDIYRGKLKPAKNFLDFALFVTFFPQLVAGPIVRAVEFLPQLEKTPFLNRERMHDGLFRIAIGLAKKVLIADMIGGFLVDPVFNQPGEFAPLIHVLAIWGFLFQIYGDFSGYSDIAIGSAKLFGFDLPENFKLPFQSRSMREFWRRWHITLSFWLRDYVFFPLGGSLRKEPRVWFNLLFTMILVGVWHGAHGLWVFYGTLNGLAMCIERYCERRRGGELFATTRFKSAISWIITFNFIAASTVCVRARTWDEFFGVYREFGDSYGVSPKAFIPMIAIAIIHFTPYRYHKAFKQRFCALPSPVIGVALGAVLGLVAYFVVGETPYIYFQF